MAFTCPTCSQRTSGRPTQGQYQANYDSSSKLCNCNPTVRRQRINKCFEDGETCLVTLKDRFKKQSEDEKLWYDQAFGPLRNFMKIELSFTPPPDQVSAGKFLFFAKIDYTIFPEMVDDFQEDLDKGLYPASDLYLMETDILENDVTEYALELDRPYGEYTVQIFYRPIDGQQADGNGEPELKPLDQQFYPYFRDSCVPEPISRDA